MPRKTIPQQELAWTDPEDFTLVTESTIDGQRVEAEARQRERERQESQSKNLLLFECECGEKLKKDEYCACHQWRDQLS